MLACIFVFLGLNPGLNPVRALLLNVVLNFGAYPLLVPCLSSTFYVVMNKGSTCVACTLGCNVYGVSHILIQYIGDSIVCGYQGNPDGSAAGVVWGQSQGSNSCPHTCQRSVIPLSYISGHFG